MMLFNETKFLKEFAEIKDLSKYSKDCKNLILNEEITDVELCKWIVDFD